MIMKNYYPAHRYESSHKDHHKGWPEWISNDIPLELTDLLNYFYGKLKDHTIELTATDITNQMTF